MGIFFRIHETFLELRDKLIIDVLEWVDNIDNTLYEVTYKKYKDLVRDYILLKNIEEQLKAEIKRKQALKKRLQKKLT